MTDLPKYVLCITLVLLMILLCCLYCCVCKINNVNKTQFVIFFVFPSCLDILYLIDFIGLQDYFTHFEPMVGGAKKKQISPKNTPDRTFLAYLRGIST